MAGGCCAGVCAGTCAWACAGVPGGVLWCVREDRLGVLGAAFLRAMVAGKNFNHRQENQSAALQPIQVRSGRNNWCLLVGSGERCGEWEPRGGRGRVGPDHCEEGGDRLWTVPNWRGVYLEDSRHSKG